MTVRAILFDVGDTLVRVGPFDDDLGPRLAKVVVEAGVECRDGELLDSCGRAFAALREELLGSFAAGTEDEHDIGEMLVRLLAAEGLLVHPHMAEQLGDVVGRADVERLEPRPDVIEVLRSFREAGYRLAAVSNTTTRPALLNALYEECGLFPCLEEWVYSAALGVRKPHPMVYQRALELLSVTGDETVFVGDRVREDVVGPRRAGIAHAVLTHEYRQEDPGESQPCAVITFLEELHRVLPRLA